MLFHDRTHPRDLGAEAVRAFLSHLAAVEKVAALTQNQALAALTLRYSQVLSTAFARIDGIAPARRSDHVPVVLTKQELRSLLRHAAGGARLCMLLMYGSGLRVSECVSLRVKDVDLACTGIPGRLLRKYPRGDREWRWQYVFASTRTIVGAGGVTRRHHVQESTVQRAMRAAVEAAHIDKRVDVPQLAAFLRDASPGAGSDIRTIQVLLGHEDLETTMKYTHVLNRGAESGGQSVGRASPAGSAQIGMHFALSDMVRSDNTEMTSAGDVQLFAHSAGEERLILLGLERCPAHASRCSLRAGCRWSHSPHLCATSHSI